MKLSRIIFTLLLSYVTSNAIYANNYSFLNYSAVFYFKGNDTNMMAANINKALNQTPDGKKSSWKNPATGAWGYAIPSHTSQNNGMHCRNLIIYNNAHHVSGESHYTYCKIKGEWKINAQ